MTRKRTDHGQAALFASGPRRVARQRRGLDALLAELRRSDRVYRDQADLITLLRTLADAIDAEYLDADGSSFTLARLATEYRATRSDLLGLGYQAGAVDPFTVDAFPALHLPPTPDTPRADNAQDATPADPRGGTDA